MSIVLDSTILDTIETNVVPQFEGYLAGGSLPLWKVKKGTFESYRLPVVVDPDEGDTLSMKLIFRSATLEQCECVKIAAIDEITLELK